MSKVMLIFALLLGSSSWPLTGLRVRFLPRFSRAFLRVEHAVDVGFGGSSFCYA